MNIVHALINILENTTLKIKLDTKLARAHDKDKVIKRLRANLSFNERIELRQ